MLDAAEVPELYIRANPFPTAVTIGMDKPLIVVNSALVDLLDEEELAFVLGHELGHAISGHAVYRRSCSGCSSSPACSAISMAYPSPGFRSARAASCRNGIRRRRCHGRSIPPTRRIRASGS